jgi:hypothetical protein
MDQNHSKTLTENLWEESCWIRKIWTKYPITTDIINMKFDTDISSQNLDIWKNPLQKKEGSSSIPRQIESLSLKIDPNLNIQNISYELAQWLESNLTPRDVQEWKNTLRSFLPKEQQNQVENITTADIAQMIALVVGVVLLLASWVGIVVAIWSIWARIAASAMVMRVWTMIASSPNITSVIMGLVPGMKNIAPNQALAFWVSEMKNIILYILPWMISVKLSDMKK